jgi:teichoic acid transport system ATP-binding protein
MDAVDRHVAQIPDQQAVYHSVNSVEMEPDNTPTLGSTSALPIPSVIVDDVHVVYRVYGATNKARTPASALRNVIGRPKVRRVHAIKGVSFKAYQGQTIGLIGSNGSGKSTILKAVAGLLPVNKGVIYTRGQPSLLGITAALLPDVSGEQNVILGCLAMGMSREEADEKCSEIIAFSGINEKGDFSSLPMRTYSSGMAARLRFAIAVAKKHDVLLIDEALSTGDTSFRIRSEERLVQLKREASTVVLVNHAIDAIRSNCERTIWLEGGLIRMDGPTREICEIYEKFMKEKK